MTKKDGDKLRKMRQELRSILSQYDPNSDEATSMNEICIGMTWLLEGSNIKVSQKRSRK